MNFDIEEITLRINTVANYFSRRYYGTLEIGYIPSQNVFLIYLITRASSPEIPPLITFSFGLYMNEKDFMLTPDLDVLVDNIINKFFRIAKDSI